ncbi:uncharacterized protein LOC124315674 [Daphnia pulicaria]|uniref:uncharacterized protein LOC124315674 n=1 Tax=Daphnia pulicaria TaxID=35523 RepID=UPI001EEB7E57|nr:uncharacterized protein LOC124315674 [Daphnia pulicaria]
MINSVFQISVGLNVHKSRSSIYHTLYSLELFFQFWIVCVVASRLQIKATNIIQTIRKLPTATLDTQRLAGTLLIQVHHSAPSISAYGLVKINNKLVLKLIGTTFSYFIIINQFYLLEDPLQQ